MKEKIKFDLNTERMEDLDFMIDEFSERGCVLVDDLFADLIAEYYGSNDLSDGRMMVEFTDEEGHSLSFILSQTEIHYVLHMIDRKLYTYSRDDGGGGFGDED